MKCGFCAEEISGRYLTWDDGTVACQACKETLPPCARCGMPVPDRQAGWIRRLLGGAERGPALCSSCDAQVGRCAVCEAPLMGRHVQFDGTDLRWCSACEQERDRCDFCSVPIPDRSHTYPDGRRSCADCRATAVTSRRRFKPLVEQARTYLETDLGLPLRSDRECPAHMVSADGLARRLGKRFEATPGFDKRERGFFSGQVTRTLRGDVLVAERHELAVYIEDGLPEQECFGVLVHELVHLWQYDAFPRDGADPRLVEGVACWAQHRALSARGATALARRIEKRSDPVYGQGFQLVRRVAEEEGVAGMLRRVVELAGG